MASPPIVRAAMTRWYADIHLPMLPMFLRRASTTTPRFRGLVDTGSTFTIASFAVAQFLGISRDELVKHPSTTLGGVGGKVTGYRLNCDLLLGDHPSLAYVLTDSEVVFSPRIIDDVDVLLGQRDVLERMVMHHYNQTPDRRVVLVAPGSPRR
jgi:hypothetical protein